MIGSVFLLMPTIEKPVEQAKVTYEYEADNDDELTIRVGDIVEIINKNVDQQDGWWEVSIRMGILFA